MNYAQVDSFISLWVNKHRLNLFTSVEGVENSDCRTVYLSSKHGECCQIWIDKPEAGKVCIHAADVESHQDEKFAQEWRVNIEELSEALDNAIHFVQKWLERRNA